MIAVDNRINEQGEQIIMIRSGFSHNTIKVLACFSLLTAALVILVSPGTVLA